MKTDSFKKILQQSILFITLIMPISAPVFSSTRTNDRSSDRSNNRTHAQNLKQKNLSEMYSEALNRSEIISTQEQLIVQAEERYKQTLGAVLPSVSALGSYLVQQRGASNIFPRSQPMAKITATQPLFQGFREFAGLKQSKTLVESQAYSKLNAEIQLYQDVASTFYALLSLERDYKNIQKELSLYQTRIKELSQFVKIGRSRPSEILTVETQLETQRAQLYQIEVQIQANREAAYFLTGMDREFILLDDEKSPAIIEPLHIYYSEMDKRPDIKSAQASVDAASAGIKIAEGAHLPTINLTGNYYLERFGIQNGINWDVQGAISMPIFAGGIIKSGVQVAESQKTQAELALSRIRRLAEQQVSTLHQAVIGDQTQVDAYQKITKIAEKNYRIELQDYKHGLVNNIDVLTALISFQESQRALDRAKYLVKLDFAKLESSVARRPQVSQKTAQ